MIRHLFKIIWNERKSNGWILLEYIVVFCVFWFCCDYLYFMGKSYMEPLGFDIENVYYIQMQDKGSDYHADNGEITSEQSVEWTQTFTERIKRYPGVESICFARQGVPYIGATSYYRLIMGKDSTVQQIRTRYVTSGFFEVFKIPLQSGRVFNSDDNAENKLIIASPSRNSMFGGYPDLPYQMSEIQSIYNSHEKEEYTIIGLTEKVRDSFFRPYESNIFFPEEISNINLAWTQIAIRVSPTVNHGFAERFSREMREQLNIGPYFLASVRKLEDIKKETIKGWGITDRLNSVYAITIFLIINIFLGIIGTFWHRTQARRSEIGLRIAMGATGRQVKTLLFMETLLLLFVSSIVGINICLNISGTDLLRAIDIPVADRVQLGTGFEQDVIVYLFTFFFLAIVSLLAVWYPARQASLVPPAEALHEE